MLKLTTELLGRFQELIYAKSSLRFSLSRLIILETGLRERITALNIRSYDEYFNVLQGNMNEFDNFVETITTKETYFFRLPEQFKTLREKIVPSIEALLTKEIISGKNHEVTKAGRKPIPLRIWSAGCATGEEPYSIAITLLDSLKYSRSWKLEILATDISNRALEKARSGVYNKEILDRLPEECNEKYFTISPDVVKVSEEVRGKISFRIFNLQKLISGDNGLRLVFGKNGAREHIDLNSRFDAIFCRNVMIYFDVPAQQRLVNSLYACLKPGGYLFTGGTELLHVYEHDFETVDSEDSIIYRKPENT